MIKYILLLFVALPLFATPKVDKPQKKELTQRQLQREKILSTYESVLLSGTIISVNVKDRKLLVQLSSSDTRVWLRVKKYVRVRYYGKNKAFRMIDFKNLKAGYLLNFKAPFLFHDLEQKKRSFMKIYEVEYLRTYKAVN